MIGKKIKSVADSYKEEEMLLIKAHHLKAKAEKILNENEYIKISNERLRFNKDFFWNLIYYFNDFLLPYDFMLPYEELQSFDEHF